MLNGSKCANEHFSGNFRQPDNRKRTPLLIPCQKMFRSMKMSELFGLTDDGDHAVANLLWGFGGGVPRFGGFFTITSAREPISWP